MRVLLITEGTYPYFYGGVSTWAQYLIGGLSRVTFDILSVVPNPFVNLKYRLPSNVRRLFTLPLWGNTALEEYVGGLRAYVKRRLAVRVPDELRRCLRAVLKFLVLGIGDEKELVARLSSMRGAFGELGYEDLWRSEDSWRSFKEVLLSHPSAPGMSVVEAVETFRSLEALLRPLCFEHGNYDMVHSAIASASGLIGAVLKVEEGVPYLLTEHGIYYRERLLELLRYRRSRAYKAVWKDIYRRIVKVNYLFADAIIAINRVNREWEVGLGADPFKIQIIYNGVDLDRFSPEEGYEEGLAVSVTRVDPLKDPLNLIRAADVLRREVRGARIEVYGPVDDELLYRVCVKEITARGLEGVVTFMGYVQRVEEAYCRASVVLQSSMSEGTPFAVIEALACGRPVVATDVGGVREVVGDAGIVVPPRSPHRLARAAAMIMRDRRLAIKLGEAARLRAEDLFSLESMIEKYKGMYERLVG